MADNNLEDAFRVSTLLTRLIGGQLDPAETEELNKWLEASADNLKLLEELLVQQNLSQDVAKLNGFRAEKSLSEVRRRIAEHNELKIGRTYRFRYFSRIAVAAILLIALSAGTFYLLNKAPQEIKPVAVTRPTIVGGANKAVLTLANGVRIDLKSTQTGPIAKQGQVAINKANDGKITYQSNNTNPANVKAELNSLFVPKGGQYQLTLSDGTKVWLNAATTLRYPVAFEHGERIVELSGEAYFEVAHDASKPFRVKFNGQTVEVLGTHFDINAYKDDRKSTTSLLEGSIKIRSGDHSILLKPGQSALSDEDGMISLVKTNVNDAVAWKDGLFRFNDVTVREAMKKAARWYDVEVIYEGEVPNPRILATVSIYKDIKELVENISLSTGLHYRIEGRRVILMK